jgi:hypothetical protein
MDVNPLICSPSPRDIPEVRDAWNKIKCDKLLAKYYQEYDAYRNLRDYFITHEEYTHMVVMPDDLIVKPEDFNTLLENVKEYDFHVLSGTCNFDWQSKEKFICWQHMQNARGIIRNYMTEEDFDNVPGGIIQVQFEGFACCFIRRDVLDDIEFNGTTCPDGSRRSFDWQFAVDCDVKGITLRVNKYVRMLHLNNRLGTSNSLIMEEWGRDKYPSKMVFEPA